VHYIKKNILRILKNHKPGLISTMPRSGTWYNREFIFFYSQLIDGKKPEQIIEKMIKDKTKIKYMINVDKKKFSYDSFFVSHWMPPGFTNNYKGKLRDQWDNLQFYSTEVPSKYTEFMDIYNVNYHCNAYRNKDAKVAFYYRNPLDQAVAYFKVIQTHKVKDLIFYIDNKGKKNLIKDIHTLLRTVFIDMYIKQYLSFKLMKDIFPSNFLLLEYESMVRNPEKNFLKVLNFFGHDVVKLNLLKEFNQAIKLSSKESIMNLENSYGKSISDAAISNKERQLSDGTIGKWKKSLNDDDLKYIDQRFGQFDLRLNNFTTE
jgi:hypothetical protein|tara:strand:- start:253 stop:1203 length:951 start_codon:yes stop_codon:yes gene_type:complete